MSEVNAFTEKLTTDPDVKGVLGRSVLKMLHWNKIHSKGTRISFCKEIYLTASVVVFSRKNFYLLDAMNEKIEQLVQFGFITFWYRENFNTDFSKAKLSKSPKVLTLRHLMGCFYILLVGCSASFLIFVIEMWKHE